LPTETMEDVEAIVDLARRARNEAGPRTKRVQINVSVGTFVPKPHTPFQWERQLSLGESQDLIDHLKSLLPRRGFKLKWHDPRQSVMEGVFSRGDRRLSELIETVWKAGARLDGWSEHYSLERWQDAAGVCGIDLDAYLEARDPGEPLPWDHLDSGVDREFLARERERAMLREYTPDCRTAGCQQCGLCDFRTIRPVICSRGKKEQHPAGKTRPVGVAPREGQQPRFRYRIHYTRLGDSRFFSHLEILQLVFRALRRSGVAVLHSQGFNPTPRVSFGAALPVGMESEVEYFDMEVAAPLQDAAVLGGALEGQLPPGMRVTGVEPAPAADAGTVVTAYETVLPKPHPEERLQRIGDFLSGDSFVIERSRKGKRSELDIRPLVRSLRIDHGTLRFELVAHQGRPGVNPREIMVDVLGFSEREALLARVRKTKRVEFHANT
ncbi:MAG TPA: DUF2344 domain-containing protein, partial [Desulfobacteraceae bacterium]|nr:DUF2344 domain-containing protein [Desulfobacteraceae bacterium]